MHRPASSEAYVYIFIRQDLPIAQQIVQTNHATFALASRFGDIDEVPNIVLIGVPDVAALRAACKLLSDNLIAHHSWHEPDFDYGFTAITTEPVAGAQRACLAHYRTWKEQLIPSSPSGLAAVSKSANACSIHAEGTNGRASAC